MVVQRNMKIKQYIKEYNILLHWWLMFSIINLGVVGGFATDLVMKINNADFTKLSFVIFVIFYIFTVKLGMNIYHFCKNKNISTEMRIKSAYENNESGWFTSDILLTIGMIGTVLGFIFMLSSSFSNINATNMGSIQHSLTTMSAGMSTALFTTASGLICSLILKIQLFVFDKHLEKKEKNVS